MFIGFWRNTNKMGNKNSGRTKGVKNKNGYTVSDKAMAVRKMAALKHGGRSNIIKKYVEGGKSPVKVVKDGEVNELRKDLYMHYLVNMSEPSAIMADVLASLLVEVDMARLKNDESGDVLTPNLIKAADVAGRLATSIQKMKTGNKQTIEVLHKDFFNDDIVVNMNKDEGGVYEQARNDGETAKSQD